MIEQREVKIIRDCYDPSEKQTETNKQYLLHLLEFELIIPRV